MRHKYPVLTVKKLLKSVSIYGSYRKNKTGTVFLEHPVQLLAFDNDNDNDNFINEHNKRV